jgi:glycosyltransferase involved in cell wall biosynthesis
MSQNKPLVSIGIPVYNGERYLEETINSILSQTYTDFELLISDNGSTDATQEVCLRYAKEDGRIKYHRNAKNLGAAPNYNLVFELSSGEYFKWADYDDLLAPDFITKCVEIFETHPDVAVVYPQAKFIDGNGDFIEDYDPQPDASSASPQVRFGRLLLDHDHRLAQASGVIRSSILRKTILHGSYPCSDEVLLAHLGLFGCYHKIPERLFFLRMHANMSSQGALASERVRVSFFDTSLRGKVVLLKWEYFKHCFIAINNSPISFYQRIICYIHVMRWALKMQNFRSLAKDLLLALHQRIPIFSGLYRETLDATKKID